MYIISIRLVCGVSCPTSVKSDGCQSVSDSLESVAPRTLCILYTHNPRTLSHPSFKCYSCGKLRSVQVFVCLTKQHPSRNVVETTRLHILSFHKTHKLNIRPNNNHDARSIVRPKPFTVVVNMQYFRQLGSVIERCSCLIGGVESSNTGKF